MFAVLLVYTNSYDVMRACFFVCIYREMAFFVFCRSSIVHRDFGVYNSL